MRRVLAYAVVALLATAAFGAAATLGVPSDNVAATGVNVTDCDTGGVTVDYTGDPGPVTAVVITSLAPSCNGGRAWATVTKFDGTSPVSSTALATVSGGQVTIPLPSAVPAANVQRYHAVVVAP
jgi:hypothetical protein